MSSTSDYIITNLRRVAERQQKPVREILDKPRPIGEKEQVRRFLNGTYRQMLMDGQIDGAQYTRMCKAMGKKLGVV